MIALIGIKFIGDKPDIGLVASTTSIKVTGTFVGEVGSITSALPR